MWGATDESGARYNSSAGNLPSYIRSVDFRHGSMEFPPHIDSGLFVFGPNCSGSVARPFIEICRLLQKFDRKVRLPANMFGEIELRRPAASGQLFQASNRAIFQARRSIPPSPVTVASLRLAARGELPARFHFYAK